MSMDAEQIVDRRRLRRKLSFWRVIAFVALAVVIVGGLIVAAGRETFVRARPPADRPRHHLRLHHRRSRAERAPRQDRQRRRRQGRHRVDRLDRRRHGRRRSALRGPAQARRQEADRRHHRHRRRLGRLHGGDRHRPCRRPAELDHRLDRRDLPVPRGRASSSTSSASASRRSRARRSRPSRRRSIPPRRRPRRSSPASSPTPTTGSSTSSPSGATSLATDALALADGRIFTGRQALQANLIDEIGGEEAAIDWLAAKGVDRKLPVKDWERERSGGGWFSADAAVLWVARAVGIAPSSSAMAGSAPLPER